VGAVSLLDKYGKLLPPEELANAFMKAETKAKRRVTLSICGLGFLDESEIESIAEAKRVRVNFETGDIEREGPPSARPTMSLMPASPKRFSSEEEEMQVQRALAELSATSNQEGLLLWAEEGKVRIQGYSDHARAVLREAYKKKKQSLVHEQETVEMEPISGPAMGPESSAA
jgi:hypothetical protein